jgi:hypothetical protein
MAYTVDPRVDAYIDALPEWQQSICRQVRDLVRGADPEVVETIKRTRQPRRRLAQAEARRSGLTPRLHPAIPAWRSPA